EKTGTGTLVLATDNTYTGTTTVSAGILNIRSAGALPFSVFGSPTVKSGATLQLQALNGPVIVPLSLAGTGSNGGGALENGAGNSQWIAEITLAADSRIAVDGPGDTLTLTGGVHGPGGLEKTGAGTLVLSSTINNYSGATTVNAGTLALSGSGSIAS